MVTCLVVEDHSDTREGYVEYLSYCGFDVLTAAGADEMRTVLAARTPDVIVMDLQLPRTDGFALIRELKTTELTRETPVLVVSACVRDVDRDKARRAGCDAFVAKPCDPECVLTELKKLLARKPPT